MGLTDNYDFSITFNVGLASVLGMMVDKHYPIRQSTNDSERSKIFADYPINPKGGTNHVYYYSDCVELTRFTDMQVSILDVMPVGGSDAKILNSIIYKPLRSVREINNISVKIFDQRGLKVKYSDDGNILMILHLRPKKYK